MIAYRLHLKNKRGNAPATCTSALNGLKFFYIRITRQAANEDKPLSYKSLGHIYEKACKTVGVNNAEGLHSLRTARLGGHIDRCSHCGTLRVTYHSCRNRHCPECRHMPRERWLEKRNEQAMGLVFGGQFIENMTNACQRRDLKFAGNQYNRLKSRLYEKKWVIDVRDPVKNPENVL